MDELKMNLENCFGIQKLNQSIDYSNNNVAVIYAPNGTMKSSLAKTFEAIRDKRPVEEKVFGCDSSYSIVDENNTNIPSESIMVINPFDEKGGKLETKEEQDAAAALAKDIYINNLTISAINNGTYDMTRAYFADDNVKKAFKEKGIIKDNESSDAWQQDVLDKMDKIAESYDAEIDKLSALQSANDKDVPIEFLQIAASENVNHNINIDSLKRQRESYYNDYANKKQEANLDENPMYEKAMELEVKINNLYRLYDQRRAIEEEVKKTKLLTSRIALDSINKTIKKEQEELGNDKNLSAADILFSLGNVYSHNKKAREIDADLEKLITDTVNTGDFKSLEEYLGLKEGRFNKIQNEEDLTAFKKEYFDKNKAYKDAMTKLNELGDGNTSLKTSYQKAVYLDTLIRGEEAAKINTVEDFQSWIGFKNNTFNEARRNAINSSYKTIGDVTRNHRDHLDELSEYFGDGIKAFFTDEPALQGSWQCTCSRIRNERVDIHNRHARMQDHRYSERLLLPHSQYEYGHRNLLSEE